MTHVNPRVLCLSDPKVSYFFLLVHSPWSTFEILLILSHFVLGIWVLYFWLRSIWKNFLYWVKLIELQRLLETFSYDISRFIKEFCVFKATIFFLIVQNVWKRTCNLYVVELNTLCCLTDFCPAPNSKSMWKERFIPTK